MVDRSEIEQQTKYVEVLNVLSPDVGSIPTVSTRSQLLKVGFYFFIDFGVINYYILKFKKTGVHNGSGL